MPRSILSRSPSSKTGCSRSATRWTWLSAARVQSGDLRDDGPLRRDLPPRLRRADRAGRARATGVRRHDAVLDAGGDRPGASGWRGARRGRHLHRQRPVPRRDAPDGREVVKPFFYRGALWCWLANTDTGPTSAASCPAASRPTPPRWSRKACACRRSSSTNGVSSTRRSCRSSCPTSASPTNASATSRRRPRRSRSASAGSRGCSIATARTR